MAAVTTYKLATYFFDREIVFDGAADASGAKWYITGEKGWTEMPALKQQTLDLVGQHGGVVMPSYFSPRAIVLSGTCRASTPDGATTARNTLSSVMAALTGVGGWMRVTEGSQTLRAGVKIAGAVRMDPPNGTGSFQFEIPLTAEDPRKYSETVTTVTKTGSTTTTHEVTNGGTIDTYPIVTLGGAGPINITNLDDVFANSTVKSIGPYNMNTGTVIDFQRKSVRYSGSDHYYKLDLAATNWWSIPAGVGAITVSMGAVPMTFAYRDAYI